MITTQCVEQTLALMREYYANDTKRTKHFLKVHAFANYISTCEKVSENTARLIELTAYVHDIGIKNAELKYGNCSGKLQEREGKLESRILLSGLALDSEEIDRICYIVAHHHTYNEIDGIDYQIIVEADFLVNFLEYDISTDGLLSAKNKIFKTATGLALCDVIKLCAD